MHGSPASTHVNTCSAFRTPEKIRDTYPRDWGGPYVINCRCGIKRPFAIAPSIAPSTRAALRTHAVACGYYASTELQVAGSNRPGAAVIASYGCMGPGCVAVPLHGMDVYACLHTGCLHTSAFSTAVLLDADDYVLAGGTLTERDRACPLASTDPRVLGSRRHSS
jgi:hypothetical protein